MKSWTLCLMATLTIVVYPTANASVETVIGPVALAQNDNLSNLIPASHSSEIMISRSQYVISYNRARRSPNWVAWKLEGKDIGNVGRSNSFSRDLDLERYLTTTGGDTTVDSTEYEGTCFDRGHQVPSRDRTDTVVDNQETFLTSNIIPQTRYLNRVIWEHFEAYTRTLVQDQNKKVYVIAGPIYDDDFGMIGPHHDIPVPSKDFKIVFIMDPEQTQITTSTPSIAVVMPNTLADGSKPTSGSACRMTASSSTVDWHQYQTTIDQVQKLSGLQILAR